APSWSRVPRNSPAARAQISFVFAYLVAGTVAALRVRHALRARQAVGARALRLRRRGRELRPVRHRRRAHAGRLHGVRGVDRARGRDLRRRSDLAPRRAPLQPLPRARRRARARERPLPASTAPAGLGARRGGLRARRGGARERGPPARALGARDTAGLRRGLCVLFGMRRETGRLGWMPSSARGRRRRPRRAAGWAGPSEARRSAPRRARSGPWPAVRVERSGTPSPPTSSATWTCTAATPRRCRPTGSSSR